MAGAMSKNSVTTERTSKLQQFKVYYEFIDRR